MRTLSNRMIGLLMAATAVTPIAAQAQTVGQNTPDRHEGGRGERGGRGDRGGPPPGPGLIRGEQTQRNMERMREAEAPRPVQQPQAMAPVPQPDRRAEQRGDRGDRQFDRQREERPAAVLNQGDRRNWQDNRADGRRDDRRDRNDGRRDDRRDWNGNRGDDRREFDNRRDDRREWSRDWRNDRRYGWQDYRNGNRSIFRVPRYVAPRGYGYNYRRWSPGFRIDPWFYSPSYWINDPWDYRLPPAYGDYRWVRYYDDVYLIDIRTGLVVDVIYSFFWR
jgi:Ni/Co efflux regulator RcnB